MRNYPDFSKMTPEARKDYFVNKCHAKCYQCFVNDNPEVISEDDTHVHYHSFISESWTCSKCGGHRIAYFNKENYEIAFPPKVFKATDPQSGLAIETKYHDFEDIMDVVLTGYAERALKSLLAIGE